MKIFRNAIIIFLWLFSINSNATFVRTFPTHCQILSKSNIEFNQKFLDFLNSWKIPGATLAVMRNNQMILSCGYGWANLEGRQPIQTDALFRLGSVSKTITAIGILKLIDQNKLNLDDKVFHILSDLKPLNNEKLNPEINKISIRNLLQMSSGWYTDRPQDYDPMFGPWSNKMLQVLNDQIPPSCEMVARMMMSVPLQFTPGTKFSYSNLNYCLLGLVLNKVTQKDGSEGYKSYIQQVILNPLGIDDMQLGSTEKMSRAKNEVTYYADNKEVFSDIDRTLDGLPYSKTNILKKNYADGGWIASAPDLVKIMQALYYNKIFSSKIKKIMLEKPSYCDKKLNCPAMGWDEVKMINGKLFINKTGSFTGTKAFILQSNAGVSYAALFNISPSGMQFINQLKKKLLEMNVDS